MFFRLSGNVTCFRLEHSSNMPEGISFTLGGIVSSVRPEQFANATLPMSVTFGGIASDVSAGAKPVVLAQGVSQAIVTTIFGLVVAIPALVFYAFLRRRCQKRIAELEEACDDIQD